MKSPMKSIAPTIGRIVAALALFAGTGAAADFSRIDKGSDFAQIVAGKTLTRPLVRLWVSRAGKITGRGVTWDVTGDWRWKDGYFCRDLFWGDDALGYNCQEVAVSGEKIRFTSDRGAGKSAEFRLK